MIAEHEGRLDGGPHLDDRFVEHSRLLLKQLLEMCCIEQVAEKRQLLVYRFPLHDLHLSAAAERVSRISTTANRSGHEVLTYAADLLCQTISCFTWYELIVFVQRFCQY